MVIIDPNKNPVGVHDRLQSETNPRHRRMLEEVRFHIAVEAGGDIDSAIARFGPNPYYIVYMSTADPLTALTKIEGPDDIREHFYLALFERIEPRLEWDIIRCLVDDECVITEGVQKNAVKGTTLVQNGIEADPDTLYLQDAHHLVIWPFDDQQRPLGEIVYHGGETPLEQVAKRPLKREDIGTYQGPRYEITD